MADQKRIVLGMSGGVDSAVAAVVLRRAGWDVLGATCNFTGDAAADAAAQDARRVCEALGIEHVVADFSATFAARVVESFCDAWAAGLTPSPCVGCNAAVKLPSLAKIADEHGIFAIATGHYARVVQLTDSARFAVKTALDVRKDQSYMLARVPQDLLARLVLPLGGMTKTDVRLLAADLNLPVAQRPDSQDLCFAAHGYRAVLAAHGIPARPGAIANTAGRVLGTHTGLVDYTYGQRQGLGIGGAPEPYFVIGKDAAANTLTVGFAAEAQMAAAVVDAPVWHAFATPPTSLECSVKLRYRSRAHACIITPYTAAGETAGGAVDGASDMAPNEVSKTAPAATPQPPAAPPAGSVLVTLRNTEALTSPGQFAVFYLGDTVLGSGMITQIIRP